MKSVCEEAWSCQLDPGHGLGGVRYVGEPRGARSDSVVPLARGVAPEPGPCPLRRCAGPRRTKNTLQRRQVKRQEVTASVTVSTVALSMRGAASAAGAVGRGPVGASLDGGIALSFESTLLALLRTILY